MGIAQKAVSCIIALHSMVRYDSSARTFYFRVFVVARILSYNGNTHSVLQRQQVFILQQDTKCILDYQSNKLFT